MNKDQVEGKFDQAMGKMKKGVGEAVGNENLADKGVAEQAKGAAKETWGNAKDAANTAANSHRDELNRSADENRSKISQSIDLWKLHQFSGTTATQTQSIRSYPSATTDSP